MNLNRLMAIVAVLAAGCATEPKPATPLLATRDEGEILIAGTSLHLTNGPLKVPGGSDLLTIIQHIRSAKGFKHGVNKITVDTLEHGEKVSCVIDLRRMTVKEANNTTFLAGTVIFVVETWPY